MTANDTMNLMIAINSIEESGKELPFKMWYALNKTKKNLVPHIENITEARNQLLGKYAVAEGQGFATEFSQEENGEVFKFKNDKSKEAYLKEIHPILSEEVTVELHKINSKDVEDLKIRMTPFMGLFFEEMVY